MTRTRAVQYGTIAGITVRHLDHQARRSRGYWVTLRNAGVEVTAEVDFGKYGHKTVLLERSSEFCRGGTRKEEHVRQAEERYVQLVGRTVNYPPYRLGSESEAVVLPAK